MESIVLFISTFGVLTFLIVLFFDFFIASPSYRGRITDHFDGRAFHGMNMLHRIIDDYPKVKFLRALFWLLLRPKSKWQCRKNNHISMPEKRVESEKISVTFVNHSTVLLQAYGLNILTDPVWSRRVSPFSFLGPKRYMEPGVTLENLPRIDYILISHNHYDHMDINTLRKIYKKYRPKIFVPLGNSLYLAKKGIIGAEDMDWWDKKSLTEEVKLTCVPAEHFSSRAFSDRNKTLWCGFVLETKRGNIYFSGDTASGKFSDKIKEKYEKFLLGFIPVAVWKPEWLMRPVHISPDDAFDLHKKLNIETTIGIHHGTFKLSDDGQDDGPDRIRFLVKNSLPKIVDFRILENGQTVLI
ncbi:MAG: MBL fold metallo-hydrolase [Minisyncoccia bacterium]